jgi:gamma-glutamylcyclotransferase (GGCT)/AIG2-like uncharacterized protein YtfP
MERPLFVYGTLRDADMLAAVLGRPLRDGERLAAVAPGYRVVHYPGRTYPALLRTPGAAARGDVLIRLTPFETDLLDQFEGEEYRRGVVPAMIDDELHEADAYLPTSAIPAPTPWSLEAWQAAHKASVLQHEARLADDIRRRLVAARPN